MSTSEGLSTDQYYVVVAVALPALLMIWAKGPRQLPMSWAKISPCIHSFLHKQKQASVLKKSIYHDIDVHFYQFFS
jgi:hypothetical protein